VSAPTRSVTGPDGIEIQPLVARYANAFDMHSENASAYADPLTMTARSGRRLGPRTRQICEWDAGGTYLYHSLTQVVITPTPKGVRAVPCRDRRGAATVTAVRRCVSEDTLRMAYQVSDPRLFGDWRAAGGSAR